MKQTNTPLKIQSLWSLVLTLFITWMSNAQTTVFSDDFSANQSATYTTSGTIASSAWSALRSGSDWGARRNTSPAQLELTNDVGATGNANGWMFANTSMSSFASPYNTTLGNNTGDITWTFNMRQPQADPGGFTAGAYGVAFVLAGQGTTNNNTGNGYAVVLGQTGATDPIRLVRYAGGLQGGALTNLITSNTSGLTDFGSEYLSIKVTYNPNNDQWELFVRNDGGSAFADPSAGTLVSQGTAVSTTYVATALTLMGGWWQGSTTASQNAFFDNAKVTVAPVLTAAPTSLAFGYQSSGTSSASQSFNLSAVNLAGFPANITVTAPSQFEVSNNNTTWGSSTTIAYSSATLAATPVYVRFSPTSTGAKSGNVTFSVTGGMTLPTVALTGTGSTNKVWAGGASANWNTAASWSPSGVPATGDFVTFNTPATIACAVDANPATLTAMTISGNANVTFTSSGGARTIILSNPGLTALDIQGGSAVSLRGSTGSGTRSMNMAFSGTGNVATIAGTLSVTNVGEGSDYDATNSVTTVNGTLKNDGSSTGTEGTITSTATNLIIGFTGTYQHALDDGTIPTATWTSTSTCLISGWAGTATAPAGITQNFGNFTWNSPSQTAAGDVSLAGTLNTVNGNFTVTSTGAGALSLGGTGTGNLSIGGNFSQTGGSFSGSLSAARTMTVNGNFSVSGGTFNLSDSGTAGNAVVVNVKGNYSHTGGTITESGSTTGSIITFNGTSPQTFTSGGTLSNTVNYSIASGATVEFGTSTITSGSNGTFNLNSGGKIITSNAAGLASSGATGTVQSTGTRTYNSGASYEFRGSNTGAFTLSTANTITGTLTFNRSAGITADQNFTASTLVLTSGAVTTGANALTVASGGTLTGGSSTAYVSGILKRIFPSPTTLLFPVGKGGNYRPVNLQVVTVTGTATITVEQNETALTGTLPAGTNLNNARTWDISQTGASAGTYKITLDGTGDTVSGTVVMLKKESGTITSNAATTPNYTNTTAFNSMVGVNNFTLGSTCAVTSNAGSNQSLCTGTSATLAANTPTYGTGTWSVTGPSTLASQFSNVNSQTASFTPAGGAGNYTLTWTVNNGNCTANSNLTVSVGATKTWNGSSWSPSAPTSIDAAVISGAFTASANGNITACSLTVNNNAAVIISSGNDVTLQGALTVSSGSFTLENNANLIQTNNVSNSGNIIVKRNSSALKRQDYTLWSSPVAGQDLLNFSPQTLTNRFYTYNSATNLYVAVTPSGTNFAAGKGYLIRMPNTHPATATIWNGQFSGVPNNGNVPFTMSNTYNLVGNPYPSPISMATFVSENTASITGTLYFWRETNLNTSNNAYCTWAGGTFVTNGQAEVYNPSGIIQTGQGFIVAAKPGMTALNFNNTQRTNNHASQFFRLTDDEERHTVWLNATNDAGMFSQTAVSYVTDATQGIDAFDGQAFADGDMALGSLLDNSAYAIQGRALPFESTDVVPLAFRSATAGAYSIAIDHTLGLFEGSQAIVIKDNLTNTEHNLKESAYSFATEAGTFNDRFELKFETMLAVNQPVMNENSVVVYKQNQQIVINTGKVKMAKVEVYDIRGSLLIEKHNINASEVKLLSDSTNQVLIVKITADTNETVTKKVIN
jgi:hypothetical protein